MGEGEGVSEFDVVPLFMIGIGFVCLCVLVALLWWRSRSDYRDGW